MREYVDDVNDAKMRNLEWSELGKWRYAEGISNAVPAIFNLEEKKKKTRKVS